jgi:hypothetical protein
VEVAPDTEEGFYSVYFSPGVPLEARLLARHLMDTAKSEGEATGRVVQIVADASGKRAAKALATALASGDQRASQRRFRPTAPTAALDSVSDDTTLVLWLRSPEIAQLVTAMPEGPGAAQLFLSALLAPPESTPLPAAWKAQVTYVTLFDDLGLQAEIARLRLKRWIEQQGLVRGQDLRPQADAYTACYLFAEVLGEIRAQEVRRPKVPLSREHVLEGLETELAKYADGTSLVDPDSHIAYYGRMSLGPGQRTAVRGGILLRYASSDSDTLIAASNRIVP